MYKHVQTCTNHNGCWWMFIPKWPLVCTPKKYQNFLMVTSTSPGLGVWVCPWSKPSGEMRLLSFSQANYHCNSKKMTHTHTHTSTTVYPHETIMKLHNFCWFWFSVWYHSPTSMTSMTSMPIFDILTVEAACVSGCLRFCHLRRLQHCLHCQGVFNHPVLIMLPKKDTYTVYSYVFT